MWDFFLAYVSGMNQYDGLWDKKEVVILVDAIMTGSRIIDIALICDIEGVLLSLI